MKQVRQIMGMPVVIEIPGETNPAVFAKLFHYFRHVDNTFSPYKAGSEISRINRGLIQPKAYSREMKQVLRLAEQTKIITRGYFDIRRGQTLDPSGIVKGWAIHNAAKMLKQLGRVNYYVEAGGDIEVAGVNPTGQTWKIGLRHPFIPNKIVKVVKLSHQGIATSGNYERGKHIYNPKTQAPADQVASLTVIGPNVYEADRMATAAFAMGKPGIAFIEQCLDLEGYLIDNQGTATLTNGFGKYL